MVELPGTSGSEHLSSGSEHHACRASVIYSEHQGTSIQLVVTGLDITLQRSSEHILRCSEYCFCQTGLICPYAPVFKLNHHTK